jgi:hypothetical protein
MWSYLKINVAYVTIASDYIILNGLCPKKNKKPSFGVLFHLPEPK